MISFIIRRLLGMIPTLFLVSILTFIIIQLPPGDFMTSWQPTWQPAGSGAWTRPRWRTCAISTGWMNPCTVQYFTWISGFVTGDFGYSFDWKRPVAELIVDRLASDAAAFADLPGVSCG